MGSDSALIFIRFIALIFILACSAAVWTAFISALMQPTARWAAIDKSKVGWALFIFFLGVFGAVPYLVSVRPKLQAVAS